LVKALRGDAELQAALALPGRVGDGQRARFEAVFQAMDVDADRALTLVSRFFAVTVMHRA
jgi:hypothetical protein